MTQNALLTARIDPALKAQADEVFAAMGLTTSEAIRMFLTRSVAEQGLPFPAKVPNRTTRKALADVKAGKVRRYRNADEMFAALDKYAKS